MITNIDIDESVFADAMRLTGARTKREVVDRALREMVARARRPSIRDLFAIGGVAPITTPRHPGRADEAGRFRIEQACAAVAQATPGVSAAKWASVAVPRRVSTGAATGRKRKRS